MRYAETVRWSIMALNKNSNTEKKDLGKYIRPSEWSIYFESWRYDELMSKIRGLSRYKHDTRKVTGLVHMLV